jgi:hypothetical protein
MDRRSGSLPPSARIAAWSLWASLILAVAGSILRDRAWYMDAAPRTTLGEVLGLAVIGTLLLYVAGGLSIVALLALIRWLWIRDRR